MVRGCETLPFGIGASRKFRNANDGNDLIGRMFAEGHLTFGTERRHLERTGTTVKGGRRRTLLFPIALDRLEPSLFYANRWIFQFPSGRMRNTFGYR